MMLRLLQWLIFGHVHEWETDQQVNLVRKEGEIPYGSAVNLRCKKCGNWKRVTLVTKIRSM